MIQHIIFLMLIVDSLSWKIFFSRLPLFFSLDPYLYVPQVRVLEMWRGVSERGLEPPVTGHHV
jgi:hypothetical protein